MAISMMDDLKQCQILSLSPKYEEARQTRGWGSEFETSLKILYLYQYTIHSLTLSHYSITKKLNRRQAYADGRYKSTTINVF